MRFLLSPFAFNHGFFFLHVYDHIVSCTARHCPFADLSMFITPMFLSRLAFPPPMILLSPHFSVLIIDYAM